MLSFNDKEGIKNIKKQHQKLIKYLTDYIIIYKQIASLCKLMVSKPYCKIIIREKDDENTIKRIIRNKKPKLVILEAGESGLLSQTRMNLKTYWIAQNLMKDGWRIDKMKNNYNGKKYT